jgi:hypothetical protein
MASLKTIVSRIFFWSYERTTWQYDVAVALILIFVLLTPHRWFRDQPEVGMPVTAEQVQLILFSDGGHRQQYRVDARMLAPPEQTPALQNELHQTLRKSLPDLNNGRFSITHIEPVRDETGTVIAYDVEVHR